MNIRCDREKLHAGKAEHGLGNCFMLLSSKRSFSCLHSQRWRTAEAGLLSPETWRSV